MLMHHQLMVKLGLRSYGCLKALKRENYLNKLINNHKKWPQQVSPNVQSSKKLRSKRCLKILLSESLYLTNKAWYQSNLHGMKIRLQAMKKFLKKRCQFKRHPQALVGIKIHLQVERHFSRKILLSNSNLRISLTFLMTQTNYPNQLQYMPSNFVRQAW